MNSRRKETVLATWSNCERYQNTEYEGSQRNGGRHSTPRMGSREEEIGTRKIYGTDN